MLICTTPATLVTLVASGISLKKSEWTNYTLLPYENSQPTHTSFSSLWHSVTCMGLSAPVGTGPFKYVARTTHEDGGDTEVIFSRFDDYWGQKPGKPHYLFA